MNRRKKASYSISVVAEMFGVHQQTIRLYEKEGLIRPSRSSGNTRQFTEEDVERLEEVIHLTHKLGVNLSGVNMILKLQRKVSRLQEQMNKLFEDTKNQLEDETDILKDNVKSGAGRLLQIKQEKAIPAPKDDNSSEDIKQPTDGFQDLEIDYEDE